MCDTTTCRHQDAAPQSRHSRRSVLAALAATTGTAAVAAGVPGIADAQPSASRLSESQSSGAQPGRNTRLAVTLLGTAAGPPPLAARYGTSSAITVDGRTYVVDCGRGSLTQYLKAGLRLPSLAGIFLTHLHSDHTVDYFSYALLAGGAAGTSGFPSPIDVYGPGPGPVPSGTPTTGQQWVLPGVPSPGTTQLTESANLAFAQSSDAFMAEHFGVDPATMLRVHDIRLPTGIDPTPQDPAPAMAPFTILENDDLKVTAVLVPHGAAVPSYAYRFDTDHGSVVFSGDTARTPNIPRIAHGADLLVHEATATDVLARTGLPPALLDHIRAVHTEIDDLGTVAAESDVRAVVATHLGPGDPALMSTQDWTRRLRRSAHIAGFPGKTTVGTDLLDIPLP
ncbi:MBL fold metallo-hydrolase [Amycolatopsis acidicola]|uniref:MBL fold metallo-hydrolase n=1 Tax=Amycolatopsis acidicola TaxID=2596893 RepID=A0A5N0V752_9PSEU|nr:MBL fold metallo-hydrolase [Amycolatopsis acidicola]KAA9160900.1 MBL fold metallo-hydrolase [Amycolatopsis acidicola]